MRFITVDDLSGIFVRSIAVDSAAARNGRIHVHDQIIAVSVLIIILIKINNLSTLGYYKYTIFFKNI